MNVSMKLFWLLFNILTLFAMSPNERLVMVLSSLVLKLTSRTSRQLQHLMVMLWYNHLNNNIISYPIVALTIIDHLWVGYAWWEFLYTSLIAIFFCISL